MNIYTIPEVRGQGAGKQIVQFLIADAKSRGTEKNLRKTDSNSRSFQSCQEQAEVYRQLESTCGTDAVTLYRAALKR